MLITRIKLPAQWNKIDMKNDMWNTRQWKGQKECTRVWKYMFIKLYTSIYDPIKCMSSDHHIHAHEMS